MNTEQLIDLITQKVMEELNRDGSSPSTPIGPPGVDTRMAESPPPHQVDEHDPDTCERCRNWGVCGVKSPEETRLLANAGASRIVATIGYSPGADGLGGLIDHTLLKPDASREMVEQLCREAAQFHFASVCVNPNWVPLCREMLRGSGVKVCTVIGFPLGAHAPDVKGYEARRAVEQGAEEVDMVINIGALKSKDYALVEQDIRGVVQAAGPSAMVKVIIETSLLTREEKIMASSLAKAAGAHYVKTSTGFAGGGATVEDVKLMRETVGPEIGVKASGGIKTKEDAAAMVAAGATRLGASAGVKIVRGEKDESKGY